MWGLETPRPRHVFRRIWLAPSPAARTAASLSVAGLGQPACLFSSAWFCLHASKPGLKSTELANF